MASSFGSGQIPSAHGQTDEHMQHATHGQGARAQSSGDGRETVRLFQASGQPPLARPSWLPTLASHQHGSQEHGSGHGRQDHFEDCSSAPVTPRHLRTSSVPPGARRRSRSADAQTQSFLGRLNFCEKWILKFDQACDHDGLRAAKELLQVVEVTVTQVKELVESFSTLDH